MSSASVCPKCGGDMSSPGSSDATQSTEQTEQTDSVSSANSTSDAKTESSDLSGNTSIIPLTLSLL